MNPTANAGMNWLFKVAGAAGGLVIAVSPCRASGPHPKLVRRAAQRAGRAKPERGTDRL